MAASQTREMLVDFGVPAFTTGAAGKVWNDVHTGNVASTHALLDTTGVFSGVDLTLTQGVPFVQSINAGVLSPPAGSKLKQLGWPASALRDGFLGEGNGFPMLELVLSNLDSSSTYDLILVASRLGVSDVQTTRYTASAHVTAAAVLDAANNVSEYVSLRGLAPNPSGEIRLEIRADASNTNLDGHFQVNALGIREFAGGSQTPLIAFDSNRLDFARVIGKGSFSSPISVYTNDGSAPTVSLIAIDDATGQAPTWMAITGSASAGSQIPLMVEPEVLAPGSYSATLYGISDGYTETAASIRFTVRDQGGALNLLYYGNSYSSYNGGVGAFVQAMAEQAGFPSPRVVQRLVGGSKLKLHLNTPTQLAAIAQALPLGDAWDFVILQGHPDFPTSTLGNPAELAADAVAIVGLVRAHSPSAKAVLYQPWARGREHSYYPGVFVDPLQMHRQIEYGYLEAEAAINAAFGSGSARRAAGGETLALRNFSPALYLLDLSHPRPSMSVMAFCAVYGAIYEARACDISPDFGTPSNLGARLNAFGLGPVEWAALAGTADRVAAPAIRRFPGSSEDFLLLTGSGGGLNGCPVKRRSIGESITFLVQSPIGTYNGLATTILLDRVPEQSSIETGLSHTNPLTVQVVAHTSALTHGGTSFTLSVPPSFEGQSFIVQGMVLGYSMKTGLSFTMTDAHLLVTVP